MNSLTRWTAVAVSGWKGGETPRSTLLPQELSLHHATSTTSETSAIDIPRFSIARPMRQRDSYQGYHTLKERQRTRNCVMKRTSIGRLRIHQRRTALDVGADATQIFLKSRASKGAACRSGLRSLEAGRHRDMYSPSFSHAHTT